MTSKERFWKAVHGEEPDRVPVSPHVVYFAAALAGMTPAEFGWSVEKSHEALFKTYQYFDKEIDALNIHSMRFAYMDVFPSAYSLLYLDWEFPPEDLPQFAQRGGQYGADLYDRIADEGFTYLISPSRIDMDKIEETYFEETLRHRQWMDRWEKEDIVNIAGPTATIPVDLLLFVRGTEGFGDLILYPEKIKAINGLMTPGMIAVNKFWAKITNSNIDVIVKSRNQTAKKKDPDARRANPEE